jgi:hypothetical protein
VLENISIDPEDLSAYMDKVGRDLFSGGLQGVVNQWEEADNFGSLIRPLVTDVSEVLELLRERQMGQDLFLADVHQKVLKSSAAGRLSESQVSRRRRKPALHGLTDPVRAAFKSGQFLETFAEPRQGMATTDNNTFLRQWFEVSFRTIGFGCCTTEEARDSKRRWFPYNKGGSYRKWYGNMDHIVDYENDGARLKSVVKEKYREKDYAQGFTDEKWDKLIEVWVLKNQHSYFLKCLSWSKISTGDFAVRYFPPGFIFDVAGSSIFLNDEQMLTSLRRRQERVGT